MNKLILATVTLCFLTLVCSTSVAQPFKIKNTPFDPGTWKAPKVKAPKWGGGGESHSTLSVIVPPSMDVNGNIWSGGSNSGVGKGKYVGKAKIAYNRTTGKAFYVSNYKNAYGRVQPSQRPAPRHNRRPQTQRPSVSTNSVQKVTWSEPTISPYNGQIFRTKYVNGQNKGRVQIGTAQMKFQNGKAYYTAYGKSVWKASSSSNTLTTKVDQNGNVVYRDGIKIGGIDANKFHSMNNDQKIAVGLAHVIGELINN